MPASPLRRASSSNIICLAMVSPLRLGSGLPDDRQNLALLDDLQLLAVHLDLRAGILRIKDDVACGHGGVCDPAAAEVAAPPHRADFPAGGRLLPPVGGPECPPPL